MSKNEDFSRRLRETRENRKMKQSDVARRTGLQPSAISQFENAQREPSHDNLKKLASALGVSTDYLLYGTTSVGVAGPQLRAVVRYAQSMTGEDLDMLENFAALLAKKGKNRLAEENGNR
ncbi:MAG: helix-turn-helix domain-containing protein [Planctomycetaceae bacterium]|nr:helix-turn-helix domain-containing protein [Planctomycetaceae bacterium]